MTDRVEAQGARAIEVAQGRTHPEFHLDGLSDPSGAYRAAGPGRARLFAHATGALLSLTVIGFGGYWGYKQIMRDVHGVPVVRALDGPIRVAPDDPGGQVADHAGLAVNDVQAVGTASAPEDRLTLAPAPVALTEEDQPAGKLAAAPEGGVISPQAEADDAEILPREAPSPQAASLNEETLPEDPIARALALAESSTAGARPLTATELTVASGAAVASIAPDAAAGPQSEGEATVTNVAVRSMRPLPRPTRRSPANAAVETAVASALAGADADAEGSQRAPAVLEASAVPIGTRLVQLGAFDSPDDARAAWSGIAGRFDGLMDDKTQVIVEAKAGGRTFWRLRAMGFGDLAEARRFCAALVAERADCIPVVAK